MSRFSRRQFVRSSVLGVGFATLGWPALASGGSGSEPGSEAAAVKKAFLAAVEAGDLAAVRRFLTADATLVAARDGALRSPFLIASLHRHAEVAKELRARGYRLDLHELAFMGEWEAFEELAAENEGEVNAIHPVGGTAMVAAALGGAGTSIWRVYSQGGNPNLRADSPDAMTPVRAALEHPDLTVAEFTAATLLANDGRADTVEPDGGTLLHAATARGSVAVVEMLIRKGASMSAVDAEGRTALSVAEEMKRADLVELLRHHRRIPRDHSTSRTAYDVEGKVYRAPDLSALPPARQRSVVGLAHRDFDAVREQVKAAPGLAHSVATTSEWAVEAGAHMGRQEIVDYLLDHGAPYGLATAVMRGDTATVRRRLAEDPLRIHERGAHDFPLLWYPIIGGGHLELASLLLDAGAEPERQHYLGTTALHWAAMSGMVEMAELLIEAGADPNRLGRKFGSKPLTPLALAQARDRTEMVALLRSRGAR